MKNKIINLFVAIIIAFNAYTIDFPNKNGWQHHNKSKTKSASSSTIPDNASNDFMYDRTTNRSNINIYSRVGPIERNPNHKLAYSSGPQASSDKNASKTNLNSAQPPKVNLTNNQNASPEKESKPEVKTNPDYKSVAHKADLEAAYSMNSAVSSSNQSSSVSAVVNFSVSGDGSNAKNSSITGATGESKINSDYKSVATKSDVETVYLTIPQMGSSNQNPSVNAVINIPALENESNSKNSSENRPSTSNINILSGSVPADCNANFNLVYSSVPQTNSSTQNAPSTTSVPNSVSPGTSTNNQNSFDKTMLAGIYVTDSQERSTANKSDIIGNHQPSSQKDSSNQNEATAKLVLRSDMSDNSSNRNSSADATTQKDKIDSDSRSVIHVDGTKIVLSASQNNLSNQNKSIIGSTVILARPEGSSNNQNSSAASINFESGSHGSDTANSNPTTEKKDLSNQKKSRTRSALISAMPENLSDKQNSSENPATIANTKIDSESSHADIEKTKMLLEKYGNELAKIKEKDRQAIQDLSLLKFQNLCVSKIIDYEKVRFQVFDHRYKIARQLQKHGYWREYDGIQSVAKCAYRPDLAFTVFYHGVSLAQRALPYIANLFKDGLVIATVQCISTKNKDRRFTFDERVNAFDLQSAELPPLSGSITMRPETQWEVSHGYGDRIYSPQEIKKMRDEGITSPILTLDEDGKLIPDFYNVPQVDWKFNILDENRKTEKNQNENQQKLLPQKKSTANKPDKREQKSASNNQKTENEKKQTSAVTGSVDNEQKVASQSRNVARETTINEKNMPAPSSRGGKDLFEVNHRTSEEIRFLQENKKINPAFENNYKHMPQERDKNSKKEVNNKDGAKKTGGGIAGAMPPDPNDDKNKFKQKNNFRSSIDQSKIEKAVEYATSERKLDHFFTKEAHGFKKILDKMGGSDNINAQKLLAKQIVLEILESNDFSSDGLRAVSVNVAGETIEVRLSVHEGIVKIGTMYIPQKN